tara:strand:- start:38835 stop:39170 length:336 start_codon:yes stop_codon:yes gene_type:complete
MALRALIFESAAQTDGIGEIVETLKWGQPSYLTVKPKSGATIRIGVHGEGYAMFVHCSTTLVATYRELYGRELKCEGKRAVIFTMQDDLPTDVMRHCVALALTYHQRKRAA